MIKSETGVIRGKNEVLCDKCNADLTVEGSVTFCSHWDGAKEYGYCYTCNKCGNQIEQIYARQGIDAMLWEEG